MSYFEKVRDHWLQFVTNLLLALCIITLPAYTDTGKNAFYLLALLSLYYLFTNLHQLKQLDKVLKIFLQYLYCIFYGPCSLSILMAVPAVVVTLSGHVRYSCYLSHHSICYFVL